MMSQTYPQNYPHLAAYPGMLDQEDHSANSWISLFLWIPGVLAAGGLFALGQPFVAFVVLGLVVFVHTLFRPIVATYALIFCIPIETFVSVIPSVATLPKIAALLTAIVSLPRILRAIGSGRWDSTAKWVVLLLGWAALSFFWSEHSQSALIEIQTLVLVWTIPLLIAVQVDNRHKWKTALVVFIVSCLLNSMAVLMAGADVSSVVEGKARGQVQTLVGEEVLLEGNGPARMNAVAIFACLMFFFTTRASRKALAVGAILLLSIAIILFMTRNVYVGLPVSLFLGMLVMRGAGMGRRALLFAGVTLVAATCAIAAVKLGFVGEGIQRRFESIFQEGSRAGNRIEMWRAHIDFFLSTSFVGLGVSQVRFTPEALYHVAHNDLIDLAGNLGIVGVVAYLGLQIGLFFRLRRIKDLWIAFFCTISWVMLIFGGMTQTDYRGKYYTLVFGLILAGIKLAERESEVGGPELSGQRAPMLFGRSAAGSMAEANSCTLQ